MATSISKTQTQLSCQLCSIQQIIKWKCIDCGLLMCDKCKTIIHSRIKTAEKHSIITVHEVDIDLLERLKALHISEVFTARLSAYSTDVSEIHKLIYCSGDIIYFMESNFGQMYRFIKAKLLKDSLNKLQELDIKCVDFAINIKDQILSCPPPYTKLKATSTTTMKTKTALNMSPMLILAIHLSQHGELILGLQEQGPRFPVRNYSTRQVAVFGSDYKHRLTFEKDATGEKLFYYARRIATDSTNSIYVIDWINDNERGRIVSIDRNGRKRFVYNGSSTLNIHEAVFNPMDIVVTSQDTAIISDSNNHALHALSAHGDLIGLQNTRTFNIEFPYSLSIDNEGYLLIGAGINKKAKIHVVKLLQ
ncbi:uncharacterized protein [Mytilus edulis]|uniref:uncharacterized protein n=1 Tax=Mytilus edulis TaxID=6550 RepID=UPI0039EEFF23